MKAWRTLKTRVLPELNPDFSNEFEITPVIRKKPTACLRLAMDEYLDSDQRLIDFRNSLTFAVGELIWVKVLEELEKSFLIQTQSNVEPQKELWCRLRKTLLFQTLGTKAIELIKNSIDAFVKKNSGKQRTSTAYLHMYFELLIETKNNKITLIVYDNAGGFEQSYQIKMNGIKNLDCLIERAPSEKRHKTEHHYLGGSGLGLRQICAEILFGHCLDYDGSPKPYYDFKHKPETAIHFDNYTKKGETGAKVTISTPIEPIPILSFKSSSNFLLKIFKHPPSNAMALGKHSKLKINPEAAEAPVIEEQPLALNCQEKNHQESERNTEAVTLRPKYSSYETIGSENDDEEIDVAAFLMAK